MGAYLLAAGAGFLAGRYLAATPATWRAVSTAAGAASRSLRGVSLTAGLRYVDMAYPSPGELMLPQEEIR